MKRLNAYLTFNGNCREAMGFYKECLGGKLTLQSLGETPMAAQMPGHMKERIVHAILTSGNITIMGSDMAPLGLVKGNAISLLLDCSSEEGARNIYAKLAEGGEATCPLQISFWGALFGDLVDKYGHHWLINYYEN